MYKEIEPLVPNTICEAREQGGKVISYRIRPAEGYKLHEITLDESVINEVTHEETGKKKLGFTKAYITASGSYDFVKNEREIYAVSEDAEEEIVDAYGNQEVIEKARAYDILTGGEI